MAYMVICINVICYLDSQEIIRIYLNESHLKAYRRACVLFTSFVFVFVQWCPTHIMLCLCFVFLLLVYPMLPVSVDCPFLIASSVFSNIYLNTPGQQGIKKIICEAEILNNVSQPIKGYPCKTALPPSPKLMVLQLYLNTILKYLPGHIIFHPSQVKFCIDALQTGICKKR